MIHRDVYFNGTELPDDGAHVATPEDLIALATGQQTSSNANDDWRIYDYLEQHCDPAQGCQTMTIPHNSNQSNGAMYMLLDPATGLTQGRDSAPLTPADAPLRSHYDRTLTTPTPQRTSQSPLGITYDNPS